MLCIQERPISTPLVYLAVLVFVRIDSSLLTLETPWNNRIELKLNSF